MNIGFYDFGLFSITSLLKPLDPHFSGMAELPQREEHESMMHRRCLLTEIGTVLTSGPPHITSITSAITTPPITNWFFLFFSIVNISLVLPRKIDEKRLQIFTSAQDIEQHATKMLH